MTSTSSFFLLAVLSIGCASTGNAPGQHPVYPPSEVSGTAAKCEKICDVPVVSTTAENFCDALVAKTRDLLGPKVTCKAQGPLGLPTRDDAAVRDAMVVELSTDDARYSLIVLRTARGWELAAEAGVVHGAAAEKPEAMRVVGARPVEAPEIAPYGVELRMRIDAQGESVDKVFVCGKQGEKTACPRAIITG